METPSCTSSTNTLPKIRPSSLNGHMVTIHNAQIFVRYHSLNVKLKFHKPSKGYDLFLSYDSVKNSRAVHANYVISTLVWQNASFILLIRIQQILM